MAGNSSFCHAAQEYSSSFPATPLPFCARREKANYYHSRVKADLSLLPALAFARQAAAGTIALSQIIVF